MLQSDEQKSLYILSSHFTLYNCSMGYNFENIYGQNDRLRMNRSQFKYVDVLHVFSLLNVCGYPLRYNIDLLDLLKEEKEEKE